MVNKAKKQGTTYETNIVNRLNKNQIACGELLIKEAGGYLTNSKYINAYDCQKDLLIGANPILHKELLKKINNKN